PSAVRSVVVDGNPTDALLAATRDQEADLLVVGGSRPGGFLHLHVGSIGHHLAHHTTVPLAVVPRAGAKPATHLVVGTDGSPGSRAAVDLAAALAAGLGIGVTAVYCFEPFGEFVPEHDPRSWHSVCLRELGEWTTPFERAGVTVEIDLDRDIHPVAAIQRALAAHPGAVAVVGTRARSSFTGLRP